MEKFKQQLDQQQPAHQEVVGYKNQGCRFPLKYNSFARFFNVSCPT
jgi:hypothetical protein